MKRVFLAICLFCTSAYIMPVAAYDDLTFSVCFDESNIIKKPRTPVKCPMASIDGHTLYIESCEGCQLQLVKDNDVVYSTVITSGVVELPDTFTGNYELRIIRGGICFWAEIEL